MTLNLIVVIAVIVLGILFMLIEIFLLPGISIAGIAGAIFLIGGIVYAYMFLGSTAGNITLAASAVALGGTFYWLVKSKSLRRIALETNIEDRVDPIGQVLVNDIEVEAKSYDGDFIDEESEVEVVKVKTYNILVKKKENESISNSITS